MAVVVIYAPQLPLHSLLVWPLLGQIERALPWEGMHPNCLSTFGRLETHPSPLCRAAPVGMTALSVSSSLASMGFVVAERRTIAAFGDIVSPNRACRSIHVLLLSSRTSLLVSMVLVYASA